MGYIIVKLKEVIIIEQLLLIAVVAYFTPAIVADVKQTRSGQG
ncbi:hypothetical protein [Alkalihalobacterium elongatum]|nr:hypothetical protein [Alkalihalobacterium elongatum]